MGWKDRFAPKDERAAFIAEVTSLLRKAKDVDRVETAGDDDFSLRVTKRGTDEPTTVNLHNLWADIHREPQRRDEQIQRFARGMAATATAPAATSWTDAAPQLMPAVRATSFRAVSPLTLVQAPLAPLLDLLTVLDYPDTMMFVNTTSAEPWGVDPAVIRVRAADNLRSRGLPAMPHPQIPGARAVLGPDGYVGSWLALPGDLAAAFSTAGPPGRLLAVAPSRDLLCVVGEDDADSVVALLEWALGNYTDNARNLSPVAYLVGTDGVQPWTPPPGHPATKAASLAQMVLIASEYSRQQTQLQALGADAEFVSSVQLFQRDDGTPWSLAVWTQGVPALLPKAEFVHFNDVEKQHTPFAVRWDDAVAIAEDALHPVMDVNLDPLLPRWRVADWPDGGVMERLRAVAVEPGAS